ncbi:hypothetical protein Bxe_A2231 [Paraburkholderia xenovorans LB400]|uniref:Uncharacterized protein n=1 Tax=Paraburkholderia xenovorans (strain LB400) TaxID=266265 RepID=Q13YV1_PARXL|nr:hypothetical protein Bxe_A2231 [Paraburkholderia xenovorans LB400]
MRDRTRDSGAGTRAGPQQDGRRESGGPAARRKRKAREPSLAIQSARLTLRGKNTATKIENNSKIFDALSVVKETDLKID